MPRVRLLNGSFVGLSGDAIVSPANSFGFMDGGIDAAYTAHFGQHVQEELQRRIREETPFGELLVAQAMTIRTLSDAIPLLISAPTMRVPMRIVDPFAIALASRAAVIAAIQAGARSVLFPGMGTGCGEIPHAFAATMMARGIQDALLPPLFPSSWREAHARHFSSAC
jgi:O-acetyl-ADP-ribose deacetylase (regulator of RNase III)